jgi:bifunctional NMN adenylyltransferase/nudix hydrolase
MAKKKVGVVVGRFQVRDPHEGHLYLLNYVKERSDKLCILIGSSGASLTKRNPLPYTIRKEMMLEYYPDAIVHQILDSRTWSRKLDKMLDELFPDCEVTLYGSRDSFRIHYTGAYPVIEIEPYGEVSGTELRRNMSPPVHKSSHRQGMIDAQNARYDISYQATDVAVIDRKSKKVLLGRKKDVDTWCFLGGFVDPKDQSLEEAMLRELKEEVTGIVTDENPVYRCGPRIDDYRYRDDDDKIMTAFYTVNYISGTPVPGVDHEGKVELEEVKWFDYHEAYNAVGPAHKVLAQKIVEMFENNQL